MKKRLGFLLFAMALTVFFSSCELILGGGGGGGSDYPSNRTFWTRSISPSGWYQVPATLRAVGSKCVVYVEDAQLDAVSEATAKNIAAEFDLSIIGKMRSTFGAESDVDNNGIVVILLLDIQDGYDPDTPGGYVAGYFDGTHLFGREVYSVSNEAEILFMDVYPAVPSSADFYGTLAHEFQHLINFSNTVAENGAAQDLWINEGLSSAAEYIYAGEQVQDRIDWYNGACKKFCVNGYTTLRSVYGHIQGNSGRVAQGL